MSDRPVLGREALDSVSPFHLLVDACGLVVQAGPSLRRAAPAVVPGRRADEVVDSDAGVLGPAVPGALPPGGLVVLRVRGTALVLRGHVVPDGDLRLFVGSPWLTGLRELAALGLTVSDFAASDPVLDHLLLQQTQEHALAQSRELSEQLRATAQELRHRAAHDRLTGLANRSALTELLAATGSPAPGAAAAPAHVAVLLIDLDGFTDINGGLGHAVGDEVLREVSRRLLAAVAPGATVARVGGDEFVVLLPSTSDTEAAVAVAESLLEVVAAPLQVLTSELCVGAAVGIAVGRSVAGPPSGAGAGAGGAGDLLLRQADLALARAKRTGTGWAVYGAAEDDVAAGRTGMVAALRAALARDGLDVAYQPLVDPSSGRTRGFEALARWTDPERGTVPPDLFVPVAEQGGLVVPLTHAVLRRATEDCAAWRSDGHDVGVAVNLSVHAVRRADVPAMVAQVLSAAGLDPRHLTVEITEGSLVDDSPRLHEQLAALRALGVVLSIDDFGTGFSSMSYLKRLPVQELKIDRSFVRDIETDPRDRAVVAALVQLAHGLGMGVVAEGVEDASAVRLLADLGCDLVQGYALARPMAGERVLGWLRGAARRGAPLPPAAPVPGPADVTEGARRLERVLALDDLARAEGPAGVVEEAQAHLAWAQQAHDDRLACHCHALLAMTEVMLGRPGSGAEHATTAVALLPEDEPPRTVVRLLTRQAVGLFVVGMTDAGLDVTRRAVDLAEQLGDPDLVAQLAANAVQAVVESGRAAEAEDWTAVLRDSSDRCPGLREEMADVIVRGLLVAGRPDLALTEAERADRLGRAPVEADGEAVWALLRAQACRGVGRLVEAHELVARASSLAEAASLTDLATSLLEEEAALAAASGDPALAYEHHRRFHAEARARWEEASSAKVGELFVQQRLGEALERAERAEEASRTDALTGTRSRRWVQEELEGSLGALPAPTGVAVVDIDHFKAVNDRFGHDTGDEVLRDVARVLLGCPGAAHAARLGGEEFLVVLHGAPSGWEAVVEELRAGTARLRWPVTAPGLVVSVSVGVCGAEPGEPVADLLRRADRRLYRAKRAGRDRAVGPWSYPPGSSDPAARP